MRNRPAGTVSFPPRLLRSKRGQRGSALILSLWALLMLSAAVFAWVKFIAQDITISGEANAGLDARALAHSGVAVALHPRVSQATPLLEQQFTPERGYKAQLTSESGKLNLNWLLQGAAQNPPTPDSPAKIVLFKKFLEAHGLSFQERERLVDCLLDWLDAGDLQRLNGAEKSGDYNPPNRGAFVSVDEIAEVKGSEPLVSQPGWKDDLTIWSRPGRIDLQSAPLSVLELLPNVGDPQAQRFIQLRQGADKLDGTADDHIFKDVNEAMQYLGVSGPAAEALAPFVILERTPVIVRIISTGQSGKVYRQVEAVAQRVPGQTNFLWWKES